MWHGPNKGIFQKGITFVFICLSTLFFSVFSGGGALVAADSVSPEVFEKDALMPLEVTVVTSVKDAYAAKAQLVKYGEITVPFSVRPYKTSARFSGGEFTEKDKVAACVEAYEDKAVQIFTQLGCDNISVGKVLQVDFNEDYGESSVLGMLTMTEGKTGATLYMPFLASGEKWETCYREDAPSSMEAFYDTYAAKFSDVTVFDPYASSKPSDWAKQGIDDFLYRYGLLDNAQGETIKRVCGNYQKGIRRDDFVYLVMNIFAQKYPDYYVGENLTAKDDGVTEKLSGDSSRSYMDMAYALGVITGEEEGSFKPEEIIKRQEAAAIVGRAVRAFQKSGLISSDDLTGQPPDFIDLAGKLDDKEMIALVTSMTDPLSGNPLMSFPDSRIFNPYGELTKEHAILTLGKLYHILEASHGQETGGGFTVNRSIIKGEALAPADFIRLAERETLQEIRFDQPVDFDKTGEQTVYLTGTDNHGTAVGLSARLRVYDGKHTLAVEAGSDPGKINAESFVLNPSLEVGMITDIKNLDFTKAGVIYYPRIRLGSDMAVCRIKVQDTTPPTGVAITHKMEKGKSLAASDFVKDIRDASQVTAAFGAAPDFSQHGRQDVTVILTDSYGNKTEITAQLHVMQDDTEVPVFGAVQEQFVQVRKDVDYLNQYLNAYLSQIKVTDDKDPEPVVAVDSSKVDLSKEGRYPVVYTATDVSGNKAAVAAYVTVTTVDPEKVCKQADKLLGQIINSGMTQKEKAQSIYTWVRYHVKYTSTGDKTDVMVGAHNAFTKAQGDCYTFYAVSEVLLTRAGIENQKVERVGGSSRHYWNLINVGTGWYHFDATPYTKPFDGFMFTESQAQEYTQERGRSYYHYDTSLHPKTVWE